MREYCPLCERNGVQTRIKCYQINWEEAIFMCSSIECPWPMELEDLLIIQRPVKVYKTIEAMEEVANKYFKEDAPSPGFLSTYTPPQTPEVVLKDTISIQAPCTVTVPTDAPIWESIDDIIFDNTTEMKDTTLSEPCDMGTTELSVQSGASSGKPKILDSKTINCKVKKLSGPSKGYVFTGKDLPSKTTSNNNNNNNNNNNVQLDGKKQIAPTNSLLVVDKLCDIRLADKLKLRRKLGSKFKPKKTEPLKKFDFDEYKREKQSTKVKKEDGGVAVITVVKEESSGNIEIKVDVSKVEKPDVLKLEKTEPDVKPEENAANDCDDDLNFVFDQFFRQTDAIGQPDNLSNEQATSGQSDISQISDSLLNSLSQDTAGLDPNPIDMEDYLDDFLSLNDTSKMNQGSFEWPLSL